MTFLRAMRVAGSRRFNSRRSTGNLLSKETLDIQLAESMLTSDLFYNLEQGETEEVVEGVYNWIAEAEEQTLATL